MDLKHFNLAHYTGHKALYELFQAYALYKKPINKALSEVGIQVQIRGGGTAETSVILATKTAQEIKLDDIDYMTAYHVGSGFHSLRNAEAKYCINAAIFFQTMMEAVINDKIQDGHFYQKWKTYLTQNNATAKELDYLDKYTTNVYRAIRNNIIHPKGSKGLLNAEKICFYHMYENLKFGWFCFVFLLNKEHDSNMDYQVNWDYMCQECHHIPKGLKEADFPDLEEFGHKLLSKHLNTINQQL